MMVPRTFIAVAVLTATSLAFGQPGPDLDQAKELFRRGNELRRAGDCEQALVLFAQSRAIVQSVPNVLNAAVCLDELGRYDEALEHYEDLLVDHKAQLTDQERAELKPEMDRLRGRLGGLQIVANVEGGHLVVDGRPRGKLPLLGPLRVLPGKREVRVIKDGYEAFTVHVEVGAGKTQRVDAQMKPLAVAGRLRLDAPELAGADVFVDGALVGKMPWEGVLAPGTHIVGARKGDIGSPPAEAVVVKGQVALVALEAFPLGPEVEIRTDPPAAELFVGDVAVGHGSWRGRLPVGKHLLRARDEGYFDSERTIEVTRLGPTNVELDLEIDEAHARWGLEPGHVVVDVLGGLMLAPSLGSGAEKSCASTFACETNPLAIGPVLGASAGYELSFGLSLEVAGGWLRLTKTTERNVSTDARLVRPVGTEPAPTSTVDFALADQLVLSGGFIGAGVGYRHPLPGPFELRLRAVAGAAFIDTRDVVTGTASTIDSSAAAEVARSGQTSSSANVLLMPDLHIGVRFDGFGAALGLSVPILLLNGPDNDHGPLSAGGGCDADSGTVGCVQGQALTEQERSHGRVVAPTPSLRLGYTFEL